MNDAILTWPGCRLNEDSRVASKESGMGGTFFCVGVNIKDQSCLGANFFDSQEDLDAGVRMFKKDFGPDYIFLCYGQENDD